MASTPILANLAGQTHTDSTCMTNAERIVVLMYHRVGESGSRKEAKYCIAPAAFRSQMQQLAAEGYRAVPLDRLLSWLEGEAPLKEGDFVLTFDDGYLGVREHALPILEQLSWPCAVFLVTDLLGGVDAWTRNDQTPGCQHALLNAHDVLAMRHRGCSFHSHTRRHKSLPSLDDASLTAELAGSRAALTALLGTADYCLSYPYGHVDERVEAATRAAGYRAAFSVQSGFNRRTVNPLRIRRIDVFGTDSSRALLRKVRLGTNDGSMLTELGYHWRRIAERMRRLGR
jgi:peptidoglycan/xylan/chitin deacetylase (PgdA/CDA1 family)